MRSFWRFVIAFLAVTGGVALLTGVFGTEFGEANYWDFHGVFFLICIALFPRLTLLLSGVPWGGVFWWLGWVFVPRFLVAVAATLAYWKSNPVLVIFAWLFAFGGESSEKYYVVRTSTSSSRRGFKSAKWVESETSREG